jgi:hypothetical protein
MATKIGKHLAICYQNSLHWLLVHAFGVVDNGGVSVVDNGGEPVITNF